MVKCSLFDSVKLGGMTTLFFVSLLIHYFGWYSSSFSLSHSAEVSFMMMATLLFRVGQMKKKIESVIIIMEIKLIDYYEWCYSAKK